MSSYAHFNDVLFVSLILSHNPSLFVHPQELNLRQVVRWGRQWDTEGEVDGDFKLKRTFKCLIDHLKKQAPTVLLNTPVRCIARPVLREGEEGRRRHHTSMHIYHSYVYVSICICR